jgi:ribonuclease E
VVRQAEIRAPVEESPRHADEAETQTRAPVTPSPEAPERAPAAPERHAAGTPVAPVEIIRAAATESFEVAAPVAPIRPAAEVTRPAPPVAEAPVAAPDLEEVLKETGLVMIETHAGKAQSVDASAEEEPAAPHRPRERRPPPPDLNAPLQQVETRKEEDQPLA